MSGPPPHNGTRTSRAAADSMRDFTEQQRRLVFDLVLRKDPDGLTRQEIGILAGLGENSVHPRVREMIDDGILEELGEERPTQSGRLAAVVTRVPGAEFCSRKKKTPTRTTPTAAEFRAATEELFVLARLAEQAGIPFSEALCKVWRWIDDGAKR